MTNKKKTTTTISSANFFRTHTSPLKINGNYLDDSEGDDDYMKDIDKQIKDREKLRLYLNRAKAVNDTALIASLSEQLGIKIEDKQLDINKDKQIDAAIMKYNALLMDKTLSPEMFGRYNFMIQTLQAQKAGATNISNPYMPQAAYAPVAAPQVSPQEQMYKELFGLFSDMISKNKAEQLTPIQQYEQFSKMISENQPSIKEQWEEMRELMKMTGVITDGNTSLDQLKLKVEMNKNDKEFSLREKELDIKKDQNEGYMSIGKEMAMALLAGATEQFMKDDSPAEIQTKQPVPGPQQYVRTNQFKNQPIPTQNEIVKYPPKSKPTEPQKNDIHLEERQNSEQEYYIDCKRCEKAFVIQHPDQSREVACSSCSWPHFFYVDNEGKRRYTGPNPNDVAQMQGLTSDKWLEAYQPGQLEFVLQKQIEILKSKED